MTNTRLVMTLGFKPLGTVPLPPKILYLGYDADEAKMAMENARDKGYAEIRVCRDPERVWLHRFKAEPVRV